MPRLYSGQKVVKGSHAKLRGIRFGKLQTVIVPKHKEVAFGTLQSILRQAAMEFEELKTFIR